jgi:hypothetical protein
MRLSHTLGGDVYHRSQLRRKNFSRRISFQNGWARLHLFAEIPKRFDFSFTAFHLMITVYTYGWRWGADTPCRRDVRLAAKRQAVLQPQTQACQPSVSWQLQGYFLRSGRLLVGVTRLNSLDAGSTNIVDATGNYAWSSHRK